MYQSLTIVSALKIPSNYVQIFESWYKFETDIVSLKNATNINAYIYMKVSTGQHHSQKC